MFAMSTSETVARALVRYAGDARHRSFFDHPVALSLIQQNADPWIADLVGVLDAGNYAPSPARLVAVPKPQWHVRSGTVLSIEDEVVYSYLGLRLLELIRGTIGWSSPHLRFSHRLAASDRKYWFQKRLVGWKAFDRMSLRRMKGNDAKYVVVTDIAGFYGNISVGRLIRELRAAGADQQDVALLTRCLNTWSQQRERGIPEGHSTSDLLAEFYLDPIDRALRALRIEHYRYNDDIRIFAATPTQARIALRELSRLMHERGLNLQSAKTEILSRAKARQRFGNVQSQLSKVAKRLQDLLSEIGDTSYIAPEDIGAMLRSDADSPAPTVVEAAWSEFEARRSSSFDKSIFHFLLGRLGEMKSDSAVDYCMKLLADKPEETTHILRYLSDVGPTSSQLDDVHAVLRSSDTIFEYQRYRIMRWATENEIEHAGLLAFARDAVREPHTLRGQQALLYLGRFGNGAADVDSLQRVLVNSMAPEVRTVAAFALERAPRSQRGNILARARGQNRMLDWAIDWALTRS